MGETIIAQWIYRALSWGVCASIIESANVYQRKYSYTDQSAPSIPIFLYNDPPLRALHDKHLRLAPWKWPDKSSYPEKPEHLRTPVNGSIKKQTLLKNFQSNLDSKISIAPCLKNLNQISIQNFQPTPCPCSKNFNRDHDRVWKLFTNQPHLDFHFSIAITFAGDQTQKPIRKNTIFWRKPAIFFQSHLDWKWWADQSHLECKIFIDPTIPLENFSARSWSRLKIVRRSIKLWFQIFNRTLLKKISSNLDEKFSTGLRLVFFCRTLIVKANRTPLKITSGSCRSFFHPTPISQWHQTLSCPPDPPNILVQIRPYELTCLRVSWLSKVSLNYPRNISDGEKSPSILDTSNTLALLSCQ